jgi:hypothetical protein
MRFVDDGLWITFRERTDDGEGEIRVAYPWTPERAEAWAHGEDFGVSARASDVSVNPDAELRVRYGDDA